VANPVLALSPLGSNSGPHGGRRRRRVLRAAPMPEPQWSGLPNVLCGDAGLTWFQLCDLAKIPRGLGSGHAYCSNLMRRLLKALQVWLMQGWFDRGWYVGGLGDWGFF